MNSLLEKIKIILSGIFSYRIKFVNKHVFYRIIDFNNEDIYTIQCINSRVTFPLCLSELINDKDIVFGLSSSQACYLGLEYAKRMSLESSNKYIKEKEKSFGLLCRYGSYRISYRDREGNIGFINKKTLQELLMDPRDIALSMDLIQNFDAAQAFYIGFNAGIMLRNNVVKVRKNYPNLRLIK